MEKFRGRKNFKILELSGVPNIEHDTHFFLAIKIVVLFFLFWKCFCVCRVMLESSGRLKKKKVESKAVSTP